MTLTASVPVNERVLHLLVCIARHGQAVSARDLAAQSRLPLSTVYRHLKLLKKWGLIQEHAQTGLVEAGPVSVQLARGFDQQSWLMAQARPEIEQLVARTGESVGLLAYVNGQIICLDMQDSEHALRCSFAKGRANSTVRGASAKALLAFLPDALQQELIAKEFPERVSHAGDASCDRAELLQQLQIIRQQRYATSDSEIDIGIWGVSVPVFSPHGRLEASLSLMAPSARVQDKKNELINSTVAAADRISRALQQV
ncbi:MAG: IclR family transcriptional regulator [Burkholderiales bacterium]|nr:IclR family transcriptional regulator [Burkholderiales bacterium]